MEVWYAGGNTSKAVRISLVMCLNVTSLAEYKFRPDKLWYRGKAQANKVIFFYI